VLWLTTGCGLSLQSLLFSKLASEKHNVNSHAIGVITQATSKAIVRVIVSEFMSVVSATMLLSYNEYSGSQDHELTRECRTSSPPGIITCGSPCL